MSVFIFIFPFRLSGQTTPPARLVDAPTAGSLSGKSYLFETHLFDGDGVIQTFGIGITDLVDIGCSYGGCGIVGAGKVAWQPHVAFQIRIRIIEESLTGPAVAVGFDSQGFGPYVKRGEGGKELNRFRTKSRGAYLAVSRNYSLLGDLGLHGGINYSLEFDDGDFEPTFWAGIDKNLGKSIEICAEYDFAMNDNDDSDITRNRGYLNCAVKWRIGGAFTLELDIRNMLRNTKKDIAGFIDGEPEASRELRFSYQRSF